jgi:hypothetical protein
MKTLKSSLLLLSVFILVTSFTPAKKKFIFDSDEGRFSVIFPAEYTTETEKGEGVTTIKTSCTLKGQTYFASYSLHEIKMVDHKEMAQVSYDSFMKAVGGELRSKTEWKVGDHSGLMAVMELVESSVKLEYRVVLVGNIQYQLVVMAPNADYNEKGAAKFFKSFTLK